MKPFNNFVVYRLTREVDLSSLPDQVSVNEFKPLGDHDMSSMGFVPSVAGENLYYSRLGKTLLTIKKEEKIIPGAFLKKELAKRVAKFEEMMSKKSSKAEKDSLKDEVLHSLIPKAFTKEKFNRVLIDTLSSMVIVEAKSNKSAEDALALVRKTLGSFPVIPVNCNGDLESKLTDLATGDNALSKAIVLDEVTLKSVLEDGGEVKCKKQEVISDEISGHIESGKRVTSIALMYDDRIKFTIDSDMRFSKVKFTDVLINQNDDIEKEDVQSRFNADFVLFTSEMKSLIEYILQSFGEVK